MRGVIIGMLDLVIRLLASEIYKNREISLALTKLEEAKHWIDNADIINHDELVRDYCVMGPEQQGNTINEKEY